MANQEWQPIETAPKDIYVLAWVGGVAILAQNVWFGSTDYKWRDDSGDSYQDYRPTHWMRLPDPPKEQQ